MSSSPMSIFPVATDFSFVRLFLLCRGWLGVVSSKFRIVCRHIQQFSQFLHSNISFIPLKRVFFIKNCYIKIKWISTNYILVLSYKMQKVSCVHLVNGAYLCYFVM